MPPNVFYDGFDGNYGIYDLAPGDFYVIAKGNGFIPFEGMVTIGGQGNFFDVTLDRFVAIESTMVSMVGLDASGNETTASTHNLTWMPVDPGDYWAVVNYVAFISDDPDLDIAGVVLIRELLVSDLNSGTTTILTFTQDDFTAAGGSEPASGDMMYWRVFALDISSDDEETIFNEIGDPSSGLKMEELVSRQVGSTFNPDVTDPEMDPSFVPFIVGGGTFMSSGDPGAGGGGPPPGGALTVTVVPESGPDVLTFSKPTFNWNDIGADNYEITIFGPAGYFYSQIFGAGSDSFTYPPPPQPGFPPNPGDPDPLFNSGQYQVDIEAFDENFNSIGFGGTSFEVKPGGGGP